ncbi:MAG: alpha/beta hydrolase [Gaiellaceae bacterium]
MRRRGRALLALGIALLVAGTAISAVSAAPGAAPKGRFKVNGHKLYLICSGSGRPVVVLDAGLGSDHGIWSNPARSAKRLHTRVCAYDRYGNGLSARTSKVKTIGAAAADLHGLLLKAKLKAPYVLVAHSIAGLVDREFARRFPKDVAGMVLLDTAPDDWDVYTGTKTFTYGNESLNVVAASAALRARDSLGAKPLIVIESGNPVDVSGWAGGKSDFYDYWDSAQRALARISSNSVFAVATSIGHEITVNAPALTEETMRLVVNAVRTRATLPACAASTLPKKGGACDAA